MRPTVSLIPMSTMRGMCGDHNKVQRSLESGVRVWVSTYSSPPSFRTKSSFSAFTSAQWSVRLVPYKPWLVVSQSTCPQLSSSPGARTTLSTSCGPCINKHLPVLLLQHQHRQRGERQARHDHAGWKAHTSCCDRQGDDVLYLFLQKQKSAHR